MAFTDDTFRSRRQQPGTFFPTQRNRGGGSFFPRQNRPSGATPSGVRTYVHQRVPIDVLQPNVDIERDPVAPEPEVGARWGRPAALRFQLNANTNTDQEEQDEPPTMAVVEELNEYEVFTGKGVLQATDHDGNVVAESPDPLPIVFGGPGGEASIGVQVFTVFFCGNFIEEREEQEQLPGGAIAITPVKRHIKQYIEWTAAVDEVFAVRARGKSWGE